MNIKTLQDGLRIWNLLNEKKRELEQVKDFPDDQDIDASAGGITFKVKAQAINKELKAKKRALKDEVDDLQAQFDAL